MSHSLAFFIGIFLTAIADYLCKHEVLEKYEKLKPTGVKNIIGIICLVAGMFLCYSVQNYLH